MKQKNLKQIDLAKGTGISTPGVNKYFKRGAVPKSMELLAISRLLQVPMEYLLCGSSESYETPANITDLDEAMQAREETLKKVKAAKAEDAKAWEEVQVILRRMNLPEGRTVVGRWIVSKDMDPMSCLTKTMEVCPAQILGQNSELNR